MSKEDDEDIYRFCEYIEKLPENKNVDWRALSEIELQHVLRKYAPNYIREHYWNDLK